MSEEGQRVEASLDRIRKFSKVVGAILRVSFVLVLLYWLAFTALSIVSMTFSVDFGIDHGVDLCSARSFGYWFHYGYPS